MADNPVSPSENLVDALDELGRIALAAGRVMSIAIYGGPCLMPVSNLRVATGDVVAVAQHGKTVPSTARRKPWTTAAGCAIRLDDWVRALSQPQCRGLRNSTCCFRTLSERGRAGSARGAPAPEYMLAMTLMALRLDPASARDDLDDILSLMQVVGL